MTGRAKGRARGRSRGGVQPEARRPGEPQPTPPSGAEQQYVGRGRGRAVTSAPPPAQQQPPPKPPVQQMAEMGMNGSAQPQPKPHQPTAQQPTAQQPPQRGGRGVFPPEPHTRPEHITDKRGSSGTHIDVTSNFVVLRNRPDCAIFQYNVSYSPQVDSRKRRLGMLYEQETLVGKVRAFDGMILYLPHRLPQDVTTVLTKTDEGQTDVTITITLTNEVHTNSPVCLQLFNILFRRILSRLEMKQIGRHYYSPQLPVKVPQHKLELWPGFITSILQYERNVMLCADISHKILRTDTVYDFLNELYSRARGNFHDIATRNLVGEIVLTRYNNKTYRIDDIDWDKNPRSTFTTLQGEISFVEYYRKAYGAELHDLEQPLLVSQPKKREIRARGEDAGPILLVPELCTRTGLTDEARADFRVMKDIAVYTRIPPQQRSETLYKFLNRIKTTPEARDILTGWNLEFDEKLLRFQGRVLPPETIYQKSNSFRYKADTADWSREMRGNTLISAVPLTNIMMVFIGRDADKAEDFVQTLKRVGPPMGINVAPKIPMLQAQDDRTDTILRIISNNLTGSTQMVIIILPTNRKDRYDAIKKFCCVDHPVPSQCILARTLSKKQMLMSVVTKVALQLNCKLGGELWALEVPLKNSMVVGIDTYHDSAQRGRSVGGFIASTNTTLTRYFCQVMFQTTGQELADNLKVCMSAALRKYHDINSQLPDRIIIYRDGVGDGQLPAVVDHELPQILASFAMQGGGYKPKFAVVVVKKRINTRLFHDIRGQLGNPPPGTVIDTEVTKPEWYDYFLVSQSVRQGTVTPTHFNVIMDTSGLKPDHMQRLTYKLCHLYYNWPGTVRVPAPCQYAHKLAFLVGQSIHKEPHKDLSDRLYFL